MHIKYLKYWLADSQITLAFLVEMLSSFPVPTEMEISEPSPVSHSWAHSIASCEPHIWLWKTFTCPGLLLMCIHSGSELDFGCDAIWFPLLTWGLIIVYPLVSLKEGLRQREGKKRAMRVFFMLPVTVTPWHFAYCHGRGSRAPLLPCGSCLVSCTSRMEKINPSKSPPCLLGTKDYTETSLLL